jgi:hypothetical protein
MSDAPNPAELDKARALFKAFQYRRPNDGEIIQVGGLDTPQLALLVGNAVCIGYKAAGNGKDYMHNFLSPLPKLYVSADGQQAYFIGGGYRFSARGFLR